jgi:hypothetical protein
MSVAMNSLPLLASDRPSSRANDETPHRRPGNDVTLPREAGMEACPFFEVRDISRHLVKRTSQNEWALANFPLAPPFDMSFLM